MYITPVELVLVLLLIAILLVIIFHDDPAPSKPGDDERPGFPGSMYDR